VQALERVGNKAELAERKAAAIGKGEARALTSTGKESRDDAGSALAAPSQADGRLQPTRSARNEGNLKLN